MAAGTLPRDIEAHGLAAWVRARPITVGLVATVMLLLTLVLGVGLGSVRIGPSETIAVILFRTLGLDIGVTWTPATEAIVWDLRLPRVLTAMLIGCGLAVAGATFQGLLRNPLADPYVLGTASGAAVGAAIAVLLPIQLVLVEFGLLHTLAFIGALGSAWLVFLLGGLGGSSWIRLLIAAPLILLASGLIIARGRSLDGMLLGDSAARHLGVDVGRERAILLALASMATAAAVAISGLIGFVGLVVPHVVRLLVGPAAYRVLPISAVSGAALLSAADLGARLVGDVPVGVVMGLLGAPFFLFLLHRSRSGYEL
jgi:iron complex transport system permease protein